VRFGQPEHLVLLRVLLIEAGDGNGWRLLDVLREGGHGLYCRHLEGRNEIDEAIRSEGWDIALLSCHMPEFPPADAVELLRTLAPDLPVVLTLEDGSRDFPFELLGNGACDFVYTSSTTRLLSVVERVCGFDRLGHDRKPPPEADPHNTIDDGEARFFQWASNIPECYWLVDAESSQFTYVSSGYEQIWGRHVEALYADRRDWLNYVYPDDRERVLEAMRAHRLGGLNIRLRVLRPDDGLRWLHVRNFPVHDDERRIVSVGGVASDVSSQLNNCRNTPYFAYFDALTALPNQLMFHDQAKRLIALAKRQDSPLGLMVIDIDRFREVNQTLGHTSGDEFLRQIAGRLSSSLRQSDVLGRLGGDVFAVLLPELASPHHAGVVARRIAAELVTPLRIDGQDVFATASMGIVFYPNDGNDPHELVSNAQIAVRHAKSQGRNNYHFYSEEMHDGIRDRLFLETDLRNATLRNEFTLHYQPKASCASGRVTGAEALLRWQHPRRGLVSPDQFIPLLEETGMIVPVGHWVLETACRQAVAWQEAGLDIPSVSVNLSARQLQSETLVDDVAAVLANTGLKPACLDLEITESMLMQDAESAVRMLAGLKSLGLTISLDDFGTGYSSLAYLKRFPIDAVKVDRSFVQDITADPDDASITRAVITMAHHLKLQVVAEGVETAEQLALLISHQCDIVQGYFFSRPLAVPAMTELLASGQRLPASLLRSETRQPMALFVAVEGFGEALAKLVADGHRVCQVPDSATAIQWLAANRVDVLVCGAPSMAFDAGTVIRLVAGSQPLCERILLADSWEWSRESVGELSGSGLVHRVIHLPLDAVAFNKTIVEALGRRHIADEYARLSQEVGVAERELLRVEEDRRRLVAENLVLQAQKGRSYRILDDVLGGLPWGVLCTDESGILVLINDVGLRLFAGRGLAPGAGLNEVLPELEGVGELATIRIDGTDFICHRCKIGLDGAQHGLMLLLEERTK